MKRTFLLSITLFLIYMAEDIYAGKLNDNSFLIEEGYNQEENVIQHIFTSSISNSNTMDFSFTEEWPIIKQTSQISLTLNWGKDYFGDTLLNYRYQLILDDIIAFAPRLSIVLPTADSGIGWGLELNLPLSLDVSERFIIHLNSGGRYDIEYKRYQLNIGGSYVFVILKNLEFLNEYLLRVSENVESSLISGVGLRAGINIKKDFQLVPGIGIYRDFNHDVNFLFVYFSAEHSI